MTSTRKTSDATVTDRAGEWVHRRHSGEWSEAQQQELDAWLAASDQHRLAYTHAQQLWRELDRFRSASFPAREATYHRVARARRTRLPGRSRLAAAGVALAVALAVGMAPLLSTPPSVYRTAKGERQSVQLADGSRVDLNTDTELELRFSPTRRTVRLVQGEAFFSVVHDAARPFEVTAAGGRIRDVGTRFNVYAAADQVRLAVIEGEVDVMTEKPGRLARWIGEAGAAGPALWAAHALSWLTDEANPPLRLVAGEQLAYTGRGELSPVGRADPALATAWREGRLAFELAPLGEVASQLSRYHAVAFHFAEPELKQLKVTGSFEVGNLPLVLDTLQSALPVTVERTDPRHMLIMRARR